MSKFTRTIFERTGTVGGWNIISNKELINIAKVLMECNYAKSGEVGKEHKENAIDFLGHTIRSPTSHYTFISLVEDVNTGEYVAYLIARHNVIIDVQAVAEYKDSTFCEELLADFIEKYTGAFEVFQTSWSGVDTRLGELYKKLGFTITEKQDTINNGLVDLNGTLPGNPNLNKILLDKNPGRYEFMKTYAIVDGHYTLEELEALLALARKELTK